MFLRPPPGYLGRDAGVVGAQGQPYRTRQQGKLKLHEIKLDELVYLLTRLRVGEFINPVGEIRLSRVDPDGLAYQIVTSEQDDFVNTRGKLSFASLDLNQKRYGPMRLDVSANHLHGPTLVSLDKALSAIPVEGVELAQLREQYLENRQGQGPAPADQQSEDTDQRFLPQAARR